MRLFWEVVNYLIKYQTQFSNRRTQTSEILCKNINVEKNTVRVSTTV